MEVTLVDRNNYHLFQPLLYQVATAYLVKEIAYPVRSTLRGMGNVHFQLGSVDCIDLHNRRVFTERGPIDYDSSYWQ